MAEIDEADDGVDENPRLPLPPYSLCLLVVSNHIFYHSYAFLLSNAIVYRAGASILEMFQFRPAQKWYRCSPQRANWTCVEANGAGAGAFNDGKWSNDDAIG